MQRFVLFSFLFRTVQKSASTWLSPFVVQIQNDFSWCSWILHFQTDEYIHTNTLLICRNLNFWHWEFKVIGTGGLRDDLRHSCWALKEFSVKVSNAAWLIKTANKGLLSWTPSRESQSLYCCPQPFLEIINCRLKKKNPKIKGYCSVLMDYKTESKSLKLSAKSSVPLNSQPDNTQGIFWWMWQKLKQVWVPGTRTETVQDSGTLSKVMEKDGVWQQRQGQKQNTPQENTVISRL